MAIFSLKTSIDASFYKSGIPDEIIVYTQTSPHVHNLVKDINNFNEINGGVSIAIDTSGGYQWPWAWYFRDFDVVYFDSTNQKTFKKN